MICAVMLGSGPAKAAYNPLAGGSTEISFAKSFLGTMQSHGVRLQVRGAKRQGSLVTLPAASGEVDPKTGTGTVESSGTVVFAAGGRKVILRKIAFKAKSAPLYAKVGGGQLKLATGARLTSRRSGFGAVFSATRLRLTSKFATRLNKKLHLGKSLSGGQLLGTVEVKTQPANVHLQQAGRMYLAVDPTFASKLDGLFVSINPIAPAELSGGSTLSFPVGAESVLAPDASSGTVKLGGQIELLQLGNAQVFWREIWLDPAAALLVETDVEPVPPHPGVTPQGPLLSLPPGGSASSNPKGRTISIAGRPVILTSAAANLLNEAFAAGKQTFATGESVGSISITADAE